MSLFTCQSVTMSRNFIFQCQQTSDVLQWQRCFHVISPFLFSLSLLVLGEFFTRLDSVRIKRNLFSVEKRATKSVWTKHLWFDGKKKAFLLQPLSRLFVINQYEKRNSFFLYQTSNEDSLEEEQKMIEVFYALFHDKEFKSDW